MTSNRGKRLIKVDVVMNEGHLQKLPGNGLLVNAFQSLYKYIFFILLLRSFNFSNYFYPLIAKDGRLFPNPVGSSK